jgi:hypothetical protein
VRIGERQTLYLLVLDQADRPVAGVKALAVLRYNDGLAEVTLPETDTSGIAQTSFMTPPAAPGSQVLVTVHVLYGEFFFTVDTTFVQWW